MCHRITILFFVITTLSVSSCFSVKEQQPTPMANTQNNSTSSITIPSISINYENVKNGVELTRKAYEFGGMAQIKEVIVDCHDKLKGSNDRQLLQLCTVIETASSNLNNNFVKGAGISGTAFDDQFFSFDSTDNRIESAWIRAGFTDEAQRTNIIKSLVEKTESYYNQSFSTQNQDQSSSKSVHTELVSLIENGKHTIEEYRSYLKKYGFEQSANKKLPGFNIFGMDVFLEDTLDDVIVLYFDNRQQLIAIFSFSIGSKLPLSKKFVENSPVGNGQLVFLVKKHPMSKKIERYTKEWVSEMSKMN